jgi:hypothetical protein
MLTKLLLIIVLGLRIFTLLSLANPANVITSLTQAETHQLRNIVELIPRNKFQSRPGQQLDTVTPGDGVSTTRDPLADLCINNTSVAQISEQTVFKFLPQTRDSILYNGTVLPLIPPGRAQTRINTPNAAGAIRGSALICSL